MSHAAIVRCPACAAGYRLPRALLGPRGARVTCPACRERFEVDREGVLATAAPGRAPVRAPARPARPADDERGLAAAVLDELSLRLGPSLDRAAGERRLFRSHGPDLLEAFDEYRCRAGGQAGTQAFREELRRRWGVELVPPAGTPG